MPASHLEQACLTFFLGTCSWVLILTSSLAQSATGDPRVGHQLAARLCVNCHVIGAETSDPARADIPTLPTIGNRPGVTAEYLAGRIIIPHPAMPGVPLTTAEIRDIVAYIMSLKRSD
jgi:cytochrome c